MRAHPLPEAQQYARADARRAAQGHPVVPDPGRPARARRRVDRVPRPARATDDRRARRAVCSPATTPEPRARRGPRRLRPRRRGQGARRDVLPAHEPPRGPAPGPGAAPLHRRAGGLAARVRGGPVEPAPQAGPGVRAHRLPLRRPRRLRRVPRPAAPPDADDRVAAAVARATATTSPKRSPRRASPSPSRTRWTARPPSTTRWRPRSRSRPPTRCRSRTACASSMQMNAREAMHLLELRTSPQGHPAYRRVCQEMHRLIAEEAGHRADRGGDALRRSHDLRARAPDGGARRRAAPRRCRGRRSSEKISERADQHRRATVLVTTPLRARSALDTAADLGRTTRHPCAVMPVVDLPVAMPRSSFGRGGAGCWGSRRPSRERWNNLAARAVRAKQWPQRSPGPPRSLLAGRAHPLVGNARARRPVVQHLGDAALYSAAPRPRNPPVSEAQRGPFLPADASRS